MTGPIPATWAVDPELAGARLVVDGVWRLRLPTSWPWIDHANAYLVARDDGAMLVDTGPGGDATNLVALTRAIEATGYGLADIRVLALTHAHSDHVGLANAVRAASGAEVLLHPDRDHFYRAVRDPAGQYARRERRARREGVPDWRLDDFASVAEETGSGGGDLSVERDLLPGALLASALGDWEVIAGPGHAPSQVLLVQRERRVAIVGDALCIVFASWMYYGWSEDPLREWQRTLAAIDALGQTDYALPGHGRPLTDLPQVLDEHRQGLDLLVAQTRAALGDRPVSAYELIEQIHGPTDDGMTAVDQMTVLLCVLRHLRLRGAVVRDEAPDGAFSYRLPDSDRALKSTDRGSE